MREGWTYKKLVDECSILYGYPFDSKCFSTSPDDMPLIRIRDVKEGKTSTFYNGDYPKDYIIHKGDYLIGMDGEFNISPWQSEDALLNQRVCKISCNTSSLLIRYVYRFLIKELKKIEDETPFVTVKHLSAKKINQINIPVPPIAEQERIVAELDLLSSIIDKKKAQLAEYDQLAQSIFYEMFGDPIDNPKGWEVKKLEDVVSDNCSISYGIVQSGNEVENGVPVVRPVDLVNRFVTRKGLKVIKKEISDAYKRTILNGDEILFCVRGTTGIMSFSSSELKGCNVTRGITPLTFNDRVDKFFAYYLLNSQYMQAIISEKTRGIALKQINMKDVRELPILLPPLSLQQEFAEKIEAIEKQKALVQASIAETETLFNSRMDYYFG